MAQQLTSLEISETSLVDEPACAEIDPRTGRKIRRATVAFFKRDSGFLTPDQLREHMDTLEKSRREKKKMGKFQKVLKSATTRDAIVAAVEQKAQKIAKRDSIGEDAALAKVWQEHPEAHEAYEAAPKGDLRKREPNMMQATAAEAELDRRARKRMAKDKTMTYAKALSSELDADPGLYTQYQNEAAAGTTFLVPEPNTQADSMTRKSAEDGDACPDCGEEIDAGDKFCAGCGADLAKAKAKRKRST